MRAPLLRKLADALRHPTHRARVQRAETSAHRRSSVAVILRDACGQTAELLYILRVARSGDAWSGQVAFPGGRRDAADPSDLHTALRETREEIGLSLEQPDFELLGQLPERPVSARGMVIPGMTLCPFVFVQHRPATPSLALQPSEVAAARWASEDRLHPSHVRFSVSRPYSPLPAAAACVVPAWLRDAAGLSTVSFPAVDLHGPTTSSTCEDSSAQLGAQANGAALCAGAAPLFRLWGITLGITSDLMCLAGRDPLNIPPVRAETALAQAMISARLLAGGHGPGWSHRGPSNAGI